MTTDRSRVPAGVRTGGQFAAGVRAEPDLELAAPVDPEPLTDALARYGLTLADVPADHEGVGLQQRWELVHQLAQGPDVVDVTATLNSLLGDLDTGRHRGGPVPVWWDERAAWDPDAELDRASDPDDPRWADPEARLAVWIHTRNGGGNRDCYCERIQPNGHEAGCLAAVLEAMAARPDFLADHDDSGDSTYANHYFAIADKKAVQDAVRQAPQASAQGRARATLAAVAAGAKAPWEIMPENPDTAAERDAARLELARMPATDLDPHTAAFLGIPTSDHGGYYGSPRVHTVHLSPEHLADVDAALAWADDPTGPMPAPTAAWTDRINAWTHLTRDAQRLATAQTALRQRRAAERALAEGRVDADVAAVIQAAFETSFTPYKNAEPDHDKALAAVRKHADRIAQTRPHLVEAGRSSARRAELKALDRMDAHELHWPGPRSGAPARPAKATSQQDPLEF
ncbi:hypothetical protein CHO01_40140 [Cellulomonas hominis]|uniref:Uncharacterized protein n=1 Tax=Cellulomonas hominis TaxID=156981 RepID=A0A511FM14_9CELL|nr:hypothetical protein [Cellulomonas hominis]MBB5474631.1 hypothetical protein [Cellulomonas hominis]NKY07070.1 hypothetical protein [Cellulomonas hominis]GEL48898.1 hypothetical protein CHO01_40140 [Cellulomonas hominis]